MSLSVGLGLSEYLTGGSSQCPDASYQSLCSCLTETERTSGDQAEQSGLRDIDVW